MEKIRTFGHRTFASLKIRNYRLYFIGQAISLSGTWMQTVAQGLLVLKMTNSGTILGLVTALQTLPVLFLGPLGGVVADKFSKRKILYITQSVAGILGLVLGILVLTNTVQLWMIYVLALALGFVNAFDNPTRQSFLMEMVGKEQVSNAVALNSSEVNLARVIGPTLAGILVATVGLGPCFIINGLSYVAVLVVLWMMDHTKLHVENAGSKASGHLIEGFRYVKSNPVLFDTLIMLAIIGTFTFEFSVILPLFGQFTFHSPSAAYAALMAAMGVGAMVGGLFTASRHKVTMRILVTAALLFGLSELLVALMPTLALAVLAMVIVGFFSIYFSAMGNVILQIETVPHMRGRVMALYTVCFLGSTPIGGPIIGFIGEHVGPRWGIIVGGSAAIIAAALGTMALRKEQHQGRVLEKVPEIS